MRNRIQINVFVNKHRSKMPSTVVSIMHYNAVNKDLTIIFTSGSIYVYKDVPFNVYISMRAARSKGKFLNEIIKGRYEFEAQ